MKQITAEALNLDMQYVNSSIVINDTKFSEDYSHQFTVIHPLFDIPEEKCDVEKAPPMHITKTVKYSLFALRGYLIIIMLLAIYRMIALAGIL